MAQMFSNGNLDFRQFNIGAVIDEFPRFEFFDNLDLSFDGNEIPGFIGTYRAEDALGWWNAPGPVWNATDRLLVAGDAVVLDANENAVSGWITSLLIQQNVNGAELRFNFAGFRVGAVAFQQVAMSQSNTDDIALLKTALSGADRITGSAVADYAYGWTGNDKVFGNGGNDTLMGDAGNDQIRGGTGNDRVLGGLGNDTVYGDAGADQITGGRGTDVMFGGTDAQRDLFIFTSHLESSPGATRDVIHNFARALDDISLAAMDANAGLAGNQAFGWGGKIAGANKVWYATQGGNSTVFADVNGDGQADFSVLVMGVSALTSGDFVL